MKKIIYGPEWIYCEGCGNFLKPDLNDMPRREFMELLNFIRKLRLSDKFDAVLIKRCENCKFL